MPRLYHSSAMLLVDKSSCMVSFTALCIIRGKLCRQTFRNEQLAKMGLGPLKRLFRRFGPGATEHRFMHTQVARTSLPYAPSVS